jgi:uncharacterized PurR-regulated membrane protein YhhQ (DUF165 family)
MNRRIVPPALAFLAVIVAANVVTDRYGLVVVTATAGTYLAGLAFVARDWIQETAGPGWVAPLIVVGALVSALFSPQLALASGVAFLLSELADWLVYSPLRRRGLVVASIASNVVGSVVDSILFLWLAGFPLDGWSTQTVVKVTVSTLAVLGLHYARTRTQETRA